MLFRNIGLVDEEFNYRENMFIGTEGDRITYVGEVEPEDAARFGEVYDGRNKVLMPAFVNAHGHSPMCLMRGYGENLPLGRWLNELIFPFEAHLYDEGVYWATLLSMAESIRYGIVSTSDMYFFMDAMVKAVAESGAKANISRSVVNPTADDVDKNLGLKEMIYSIEKYNNFADGRVIMEASAHAEYTNDEKMIRRVADEAKKHNVRVHVHVAETEFETKGCIERHGMTPVEYLNYCGLFDQPANAAHCVWLTDNDRRILHEKGVSVSNNPISNLKLVSGICDITKLHDAGVNVAIGTDSSASNNSLNFFESVKSHALLGKYVSGDAAAMTPQQVLFSATRGGSLAQGRDDCGLIKEGFKADLLVIDLNKPNMQCVHNVLNNLIYSADPGNIVMTMSDGKVLYENGEFRALDIEKIIAETNRAKDAMLAKL